MTAAVKTRILSGVQPSGKLHLGNYFGAIRQHIALQDHGEAFYFIADYHALTTLKEAEVREQRPARELLADNVRDVALDYLALGLDPAKATLYRQSDVPEVTELAWILATVCPMGLLERATSYKDKIGQGLRPNVGLFTYPVLMAADILIVRANAVPVGKDQVQHLEMTRDMAGYFNRAYEDVFPEPTATLGDAPVVPGTDGRKMSKSYGNTIDIFAEGKALKAAVNAVVSTPIELGTPIDPDADHVFALTKLFTTPEEQASLAAQYRDPTRNADDRGGRPFGYGDAKKNLLGKIDAAFGEARVRRKALAAAPDRVEAILQDGAARARGVARETMARVRSAVGLGVAPVG